MPEDQIQPDEPERPRIRRDRDDYDNRPRRRDEYDDDDYSGRVRDEGDATGGLIPYKNPKALISYYMGVFSLVPCLALVLGPIAILLGILGLKYKNQHPTAGGTAHAWIGIVLGSITTLGNFGAILAGVLGAALK